MDTDQLTPKKSDRLPRKALPGAQPTLRKQLIDTMQLSFDPFLSSISELTKLPDRIYVDSDPSVLDVVQRSETSYVLGNYGMGKTALRLSLEYLLRNAQGDSPSLCVTYTPFIARFIDAIGNIDTHLKDIAAEAIIDLTIQLLERAEESINPLNSTEIEGLRILGGVLPARLRRSIRSADAHIKQGGITDGCIWEPAVRPIVKSVPITPRWTYIVHELAQAKRSHPRQIDLQTILDIAHVFGFPRAFLLIDAADDSIPPQIDPQTHMSAHSKHTLSYGVNPTEIHEVMRPILEHIPAFQAQGCFLKFFLPMELQHIVHAQYRYRSLTVVPDFARLDQVSVEYFDTIITDRLRAASTSDFSVQDLNTFNNADIEGNIQHHLAELALASDGTPRRLIEIVSEFLDFHAQNGFKREANRLFITAAEWQSFLDTIKDRFDVAVQF